MPTLSDFYKSIPKKWSDLIQYLNENNSIKDFQNEDIFSQNDLNLIYSLWSGQKQINNHYEKFHFRDAITETMNIARAANKYFNDEEPWKTIKTNNDYCIFITHDKKILNQLNDNLESKKFIGNFYFNENRLGPASIYLSPKFLNNLKSILTRINITNCNTHLVILITLMLYLPDKHYFVLNEVFNNWKLNYDEKKFVAFLFKKKFLNLI